MDGPHFVYPSVCGAPFDCGEWCCHEHGCQISVWVPAFNSFGCLPRSGIIGSYGRTMFSFWGTVKLFSMMAALFYILISNEQVFEFLHVLTNICYFRFLKEYVTYNSHSSGCEMIFDCGLDLLFPNDWWFDHLFMSLRVIWVYTLKKYLFKPSAHFYIECFFFFFGYWIVGILYIFRILIPYLIYDVKISPPILFF